MRVCVCTHVFLYLKLPLSKTNQSKIYAIA